MGNGNLKNLTWSAVPSKCYLGEFIAVKQKFGKNAFQFSNRNHSRI